MRLIFRLSVAEGLCLFYSHKHLSIARSTRSKLHAKLANIFEKFAAAYSHINTR